MLFNSTQFLFLFLPLCLGSYYLVYKKRLLANLTLILFSCVFFWYAEPKCLVIILGTIAVNWLCGIGIERTFGLSKKILMWFSVGINLGVLIVYKYIGFFTTNLNALFNKTVLDVSLVMPAGLSFITFQSISYLVDVFRGSAKAPLSPLPVAEYILLFPKLMQGPIVQYHTISNEILERNESFNDFYAGSMRFITGLCKKMILANAFARAANLTFDAQKSISVAAAWLGLVCYTLQIYYDFSGYSDMAIGLGRLFGFHFPENFNYPYLSKSVAEFWRRWHISLGAWFRDYVYIPLGGNRVSKFHHSFNLFVVWMLTGIWHGADWTFLIWGIYFFVLLWIEKNTRLLKMLGSFSGCYTLLMVMLGWVIFRSADIHELCKYLEFLIGFSANGLWDLSASYLFHEYGATLALGIIFCTPVMKKIEGLESQTISRIIDVLRLYGLVISISYL